MITAIIPTLNEATRIGPIVDFLKTSRLISEILVIDDGSVDETAAIARERGATVSLSSMLGKGASMADGLARATNELLLYLDGDIHGFSGDLVEKMAAPLLDGTADFVKGTFRRKAGRVTALTARPLLKTFFPELAHIQQPLGGIISARKTFLKHVGFENDYGVDIGLLIDVHQKGGRIADVDIGTIEHDHQSLDSLSAMSLQIVRTILARASAQGRLNLLSLGDSIERERVVGVQTRSVLARVDSSKELVLFDMDGTLTERRFIDAIAEETGRRSALDGLLGNYDLGPVQRAELIARTLTGIPKATFEAVATALPLRPHAQETIVALRQAGYQVGIITDSYFIASEILRRRTFADFSVAHLLRFSKGLATGEVALSSLMTIAGGCSSHPVCKANFIGHLRRHVREGFSPALAVGNGENDVCLFKRSRKSVAVFPESEIVSAGATYHANSLAEILEHV